MNTFYSDNVDAEKYKLDTTDGSNAISGFDCTSAFDCMLLTEDILARDWLDDDWPELDDISKRLEFSTEEEEDKLVAEIGPELIRRAKVERGLDKSIKDNADVWEELAKS